MIKIAVEVLITIVILKCVVSNIDIPSPLLQRSNVLKPHEWRDSSYDTWTSWNVYGH